ncbi:MAG TPA: hypothetical protein VNA20_14130 [Frankiaceae bacterium]|nr:hypothetical protein [Frankiaceae bacterium]
MTQPRLRLKKERLTELAAGELHLVVGGESVATVAGACPALPTLRRCTTFPSCGCELTDPC